MKYKLPDNGFAKFLLHRGRRKLGVWIIPGKSIELDPPDLAELRKLGITPIPQPDKPPKKSRAVPKEIVSLPVAPAMTPEPAGSEPEREASREEPAEIEIEDLEDGEE